MKLSASEIAYYAEGAGFKQDALTVAVAVALAESDGDTGALGDKTLGTSVGLWQINLKAHPEYAPDELTLMNPVNNAAAAFKVYTEAGNTFLPWSTYKSGAYQKHMPTVQEIQSPTPAPAGTVDVVTKTGFFAGFTRTVKAAGHDIATAAKDTGKAVEKAAPVVAKVAEAQLGLTGVFPPMNFEAMGIMLAISALGQFVKNPKTNASVSAQLAAACTDVLEDLGYTVTPPATAVAATTAVAAH